MLGRMVQDDWLPAHAEGVLRLLSLPSSTGEEPYSIAMTLLDAGVPADRFRVHALDISARALASADRAVYGKNSFRSNELAFRTRHFDPTPSGYRLSDIVRRQVDFERGNLFAVDLLPGARDLRRHFLPQPVDLLRPQHAGPCHRGVGAPADVDGRVVCGPSEAGLLLSHDFVSTKVPLAFAFRKAGSGTHEPKPKAAPAARRRSAGRRGGGPRVHRTARARRASRCAAKRLRRSILGPTRTSRSRKQPDWPTRGTSLKRPGAVRSLCDSADHRRRSFTCWVWCATPAATCREAATCYRKALYLDPHHHEVLIHLALLMEKTGSEE